MLGGGYVFVEVFRCRAEILNMPQRELRSGAAFRMTIRGRLASDGADRAFC